MSVARNNKVEQEYIPIENSGGLRFHVLGSGSKGNSCVIESTSGLILIDAGFSKKETLRRLEKLSLDPEKIQAILLTHEHRDHTSGVGVVSRGLKVPVYSSYGTSQGAIVKKEVSAYTFHSRDSFMLGEIRVTTFPTSHDANEPVGFRFESLDGDAIGYITDTGVLSNEAMELISDTRILAIESNHDPDMLEHGPYPPYLKRRISSSRGHLSNLDAKNALQKNLITSKTKTIVGMHLSETNNTPKTSLDTLTVGCKHASVTVETASQYIPKSFF